MAASDREMSAFIIYHHQMTLSLCFIGQGSGGAGQRAGHQRHQLRHGAEPQVPRHVHLGDLQADQRIRSFWPP